MKKSKGYFIALEGTDGSGKGTQLKLLVKALRKRGKKVSVVDFPQYSQPSGWFVKQYLNGKYGESGDISPKLGSMFYAIDRFQTAPKIRQWLKSGRTVIANRYVFSNAGHQGAKIKSALNRRRYWSWLFDLEHKIFGIPEPDLYLVLHMPAKISHALVLNKGQRKYLGRKKQDIHEKDLKHLKSAEQSYLELAKLYHIPVIECVEKGRLLTPLEIHTKILKKI